MEKKTHIAFAIAASSVLLNPIALKYKTINIVASSIGGLLPDIDVTTSETHKDVTIISVISFLFMLTIIGLDFYYNFGILKLISKNFNIFKFILGIGLFLLICSHGLHTPHRSFMHSIFASVLLSGTIYLIFKPAVIPFFIGMISHIVIDLLNKIKVQVFYPLNYRIGFNLVSSNGFVSKIICILSLFIAFISK